MKPRRFLAVYALVFFSIFSTHGVADDSNKLHLTQVEAFNDDFDDNIMVTPAKIMIWNTVTQKEVGVRTADWALVKGLIGKDGPFKNFVLRPDGLRYFSDNGPDGINGFKHLIEQALEANDESWKGPSWNSWVEALSRPETRKNLTIISAELHSKAAFMAGIRVLYDRKLIPALPDENNIYIVGGPDFPKELKGKNDAESKANVMKLRLDLIEKQPVPADATSVENREGNGGEKLHLWGFSDDDYGNFSKAVAVLSPEVAAGRWPRIKVVLFYTGLNNPDHRPGAYVIKSDGTLRPTTFNEATRKFVLTNLKTPEQAAQDLADLEGRANSTNGKILIVVSSEDQLLLKNGKIYPTGFYLNELGVPAKALADAGYELVFANPKGNTPSLDVTSDNVKYFGNDEKKYNEIKNFYISQDDLYHPKRLADVIAGGLEQYAGVFIPGGHAPMTDLMASPELGQILRYFHQANKPTAIICHGPCALVSTVSDPVAYRQALVDGDFAKAQTIAGDWIYKGYGMTVFSSTEDILGAIKMGGEVPFYPETALQTAGGIVEVGPQRQSHVRVDRELITGQNPQSDMALCTLLLKALRK